MELKVIFMTMALLMNNERFHDLKHDEFCLINEIKSPSSQKL